MQYQLSCEISGHLNDVRHVEPIPGGLFASSSRDCTVRIWKWVDKNEWGLLNLLHPHKQLADKAGVACSHWIPAGTPGYPEGALVTAGYDHMIYVNNVESSEIIHRLEGHSEAVISLSHTSNGDIVSASIDKSIIVWHNGQVAHKLLGHESVIWAVIALPNGDIVSGSADKTIRIWRDSVCVKTIHTNYYIRGLTVIPDVGFLSCGNLHSLQLWSYDGEPLYDLLGHKDTVYNASVLPSGDIVTASEDCSFMIWHGTEPTQSILTPCGIWGVAALDNGDIAVGCQDKMIRVFTCDPARVMNQEGLNAYNENVAASLAALEAAQPKKPVIDGIEYDGMVEVSLEGSADNLKLGYYNNENPADAAERFIQKNNVPITYMDQITAFVAQAMGPKTIDPNTPMVDPYRDEPVKSSSTAPSKPSSNNTSSYGLPFPIQEPITVSTGSQISMVISKLKQLNSEFKSELEATGAASTSVLSDGELTTIENLANLVSGSLNQIVTAQFTQEQVQTLLQALNKWKGRQRFPLLDVARLATLYPDFINQAKEVLLPLVISDLEASAPVLNQMMALRVLVNAFKWKVCHAKLLTLAELVMENLSSLWNSTNKNVSSLAVSLLRNYATLIATTKSDTRIQLISIALEEAILNPEVDTSYLALALYSLGTILQSSPDLKSTAEDLGILEALALQEQNTDPQVKSSISKLKTLLASSK